MWLGSRVLDKLAAIAATQHGLFTRRQALEAGLSYDALRNGVAAGRWTQIHRGIFRIAGAPSTWQQRILGDCLAMGEKTVVSHLCAAAHWNLPDFKRGATHLIVPRGTRRPKDSRIVVHRFRDLPAADVTMHKQIPVTSVARTLIDIMPMAPSSVLQDALDAGLHRRIVSLEWLSWRLDQVGGKGRAGVTHLRSLIEERRGKPPSESPLESRFLRLLRRADLPLPERQHRLKLGSRSVRIDFAYPEFRIAIEVDSFEHHSSRRSFDRDRSRLNLLTAAGWRCLLVTDADIKEPDAILGQLRHLLGIHSFWVAVL